MRIWLGALWCTHALVVMGGGQRGVGLRRGKTCQRGCDGGGMLSCEGENIPD